MEPVLEKLKDIGETLSEIKAKMQDLVTLKPDSSIPFVLKVAIGNAFYFLARSIKVLSDLRGSSSVPLSTSGKCSLLLLQAHYPNDSQQRLFPPRSLFAAASDSSHRMQVAEFEPVRSFVSRGFLIRILSNIRYLFWAFLFQMSPIIIEQKTSTKDW